MNSTLRVFLTILATYRLASLVSSEEGPFSIFDKLRANLGGYDLGPNGEPVTNLGRGIICPLCTGVYIAAALTIAVLLPNWLTDVLLVWFGVSGAQTFLENLTSDEAIQEAIEEVAESIDDEN